MLPRLSCLTTREVSWPIAIAESLATAATLSANASIVIAVSPLVAVDCALITYSKASSVLELCPPLICDQAGIHGGGRQLVHNLTDYLPLP